MTDMAVKVRENRLRAAAERQGYVLRKSRRRDPRANDYGLYAIVEATRGARLPGATHTYDMKIDDVEEWLTRTPERA